MHASNVSRIPGGSVLLGALSTFSVGWLAYYATQDSIRRVTIRSRRKKFPLQLRPKGYVLSQSKGVDSKQIDRKDPTPAIAETSWHGGAKGKELEAIHRRFAPLRVLRRYVNPFPEWRETGVWEFLYYKMIHALLSRPHRIAWDGGLAADKSDENGRHKVDEILKVETIAKNRLWGDLKGRPCSPAEGMTYTWIGQSTCLIQMNGITILTDPVFGLQPIESIFSPTRMAPMPCKIEDLTGSEARIDVVLISHNHFDHLQLDILPLFHKNTKWFVPKGVEALLIKSGLDENQITELSWWEEYKTQVKVPARKDEKIYKVLRNLRITAAPSMHWTGRSLLDVNQSLWCSYVLRVGPSEADAVKNEIDERSFFFCCDSGYSPMTYSSIGRALGPVDAAAIPIGSYKPRWFMSLQHGDPHDAIQIAADIGARQSFATHWGTWCMSDERWDEPVSELEKAIRKQNLSPNYLTTLPFGRTVQVPGSDNEQY